MASAHHARCLSLLIACALLTACNTSGPAPATQVAVAPPVIAPSDPGVGPCADAITAYRTVLANDLETGHVARSVFDRIVPEVEEAAAACRAGRDPRARSILAATKARYGYR